LIDFWGLAYGGQAPASLFVLSPTLAY
jgi:hypothetical protein